VILHAMLLAFAIPAAASTYVGKVTRVVDGDTLVVLTPEKKTIRVRLAGIDAPELAQAYGKESQKLLEDGVLGKQVSCVHRTWDFFKRSVAVCESGLANLNVAMLFAGAAWVNGQYPEKSYDYQHAQNRARIAKRGLWAKPNPVAPWIWRKKQKA
jgi:micrococcal nuclease